MGKTYSMNAPSGFGLQSRGNGTLNEGIYISTNSSIESLLTNEPPSLPDYEFTVDFDYAIAIGDSELKLRGEFDRRVLYLSTSASSAIGAIEPIEIINAYVRYETGPWNFQFAGKNLLQ